MPDIFSDLREGKAILNQIEKLKRAGRLDDHQTGLVRILRYHFNWKLHHAVLEAVAELRNPSESLMLAICHIIADGNCELGTRLLACDAVECLLRRLRNLGEPDILERLAFGEARAILSIPQPPVLRQAVERWLELEPVSDASLVSTGPG